MSRLLLLHCLFVVLVLDIRKMFLNKWSIAYNTLHKSQPNATSISRHLSSLELNISFDDADFIEPTQLRTRYLRLPPEIIQKIISRIEDKDIGTLHSCVLVNRIWCVNTIETLWKRPSNLSRRPSPKLVPSCFPFLSEESRS